MQTSTRRLQFIAFPVFAMLGGWLTTAVVANDADVSTNLLQPGEFTQAGDPAGWTFKQPWMKGRMKVVSEGDQTFLRAGSEYAVMTAGGLVPKGATTLTVAVDSRLVDFKPGKGKWDIPQVILHALDADGRILAGTGIRYRESSDWSPQEKLLDVPEGAAAFAVTVSFKGEAGTWDIRSIRVTSDAEGLPQPQTQVAPPAAERAQSDPSRVQKSLLPEPLVQTLYQRDRVEPQPVVGARVDGHTYDVEIHVAPQGDDTATGAADAPLQSIAHAAKRAREQLAAGKGVAIRLVPGVYRTNKPLEFTGNGDAAAAPLLIEGTGEPGSAIISGAITDGFEPATWELVDAQKNLYRHAWPHNFGFFVASPYIMEAAIGQRRELLVLNRQRLTQTIIERVDTEVKRENGRKRAARSYVGYDDPRTTLEPGQFAVAEFGPGDIIDGMTYETHPHGDPNTIWLRLPEGMTPQQFADASLEIGMAESLLITEKDNVVLRNLVFQHASSYWNQAGRFYNATVRMGGSWGGGAEPVKRQHILLDGVIIRDNAGAGAMFTHVNHVTLANTQIIDNGGKGLFVGGDQVRVHDTAIDRNNWRGEQGDWMHHSTGGASIGGSHHHWSNVSVSHNFGTGFRQDGDNGHWLVENCRFNFNRGLHGGAMADLDASDMLQAHVAAGEKANGLTFEIGYGPFVVRNCQMIGNATAGLGILSSYNVRVENCLILNNGLGQIRLNSVDRSLPTRSGDTVGSQNFQLIDSIVGRTTPDAGPLFLWKGQPELSDNLARRHLHAEGNIYVVVDDSQPFHLPRDGKVVTGELAQWQQLLASQDDPDQPAANDTSSRVVNELPPHVKVHP